MKKSILTQGLTFSTGVQLRFQMDLASQCYFMAVTKNKAIPATNEVDVENRNYGLAWSQSGNNKTVQTLLSLYQKLLPRKEIRTPVKRLKLSLEKH